MKQQKKTAAGGKKALYWFGSLFTLAMLFSMALDLWLTNGSWIRPLDNKWADIRIFLPQYLSVFQLDSAPDFMGSIGKYYNRQADTRISIAAIDEYTVKEMGYPFKRKHYATLIEKLNKAGVKAIGIDVLLSDSDRDDQASDQRLADVVRKAGDVSVLVYVDPQTGELKYPIKGLGEAAKIISHPHVENTIEASGQVRRVWLFSPIKSYQDLKIKTLCGKDCAGVNLPLLAMGTYAIYKNEPLKNLELFYGGRPWRLNFRVPQERPIHPGWENNPRTEPLIYRHISVLDIIRDKLSKEERAALKGGIILVGSTAMASYDHYPSPFFASWPGVELHANVVDNILHGDFLKPVPGWIVTILTIFVIWLPLVLAGYSIRTISLASAGFMAALLVLNLFLLTRLYDMPYMSMF
ncbi:MAG: CHASE2 domain-containing protein, partial [Elusimicrobiales bacterium]